MIRVTVLYPSGDGSKFDIDYYCDKHMPMVKRLMGDALKGTGVDQGLAGGGPGEPAPYMAMGHLYFDSIVEFQNAFGPNMQAFAADAPNYTNVQPIVQISVVKQ